MARGPRPRFARCISGFPCVKRDALSLKSGNCRQFKFAVSFWHAIGFSHPASSTALGSQSASCKRNIRQQTLLKEGLYMRKTIVAVWVSALLTSALSFNALADEKKITGEGKCAKCVLKETAS